MNKFEQVSSLGHQVSLAGGCTGPGALYRKGLGQDPVQEAGTRALFGGSRAWALYREGPGTCTECGAAGALYSGHLYSKI